MRPVKNIFFLVSLAFMTCNLHAQIAMGTWRLHVATGSAIDVANSDQYIFTAYENGILRYDFTSKEKRIYTSVQGLSDIQISTILYDSIQNALYVGYKNGNSITSGTYGYNLASGKGTLYLMGDNQGEGMSGYCALVRTYNRVLTPAEITQNYNAQKSRFGL